MPTSRPSAKVSLPLWTDMTGGWGGRMRVRTTPNALGGSPWRVVVDRKALQATVNALQHVRYLFRTVVPTVRPEFGAYMYYSAIQEEGSKKQAARPHIMPAVFNNSAWINKELSKRFTEWVLHYSSLKTTHPSPALARRRVVRIWGDILNDRPKRTAIMLAYRQQIYEFGFHISTIKGYGDRRPESEVRAQMEELAGRRRALQNYYAGNRSNKLGRYTHLRMLHYSPHRWRRGKKVK